MSKFATIKRVSLAFLGEEWKDCYLRFRGISFNESLDLADIKADEAQAKETADKVLGILREHFVDGKGFDGKEVIDVAKEDLGELPVNVITESIKGLSGTLDPNS